MQSEAAHQLLQAINNIIEEYSKHTDKDVLKIVSQLRNINKEITEIDIINESFKII